MKTCFLSALAAVVLLPGSALAELDFTLQHQAQNTDAISQDQPYITDGPSKIYLRFPGNWKVLDGARKLELLPNVPNASVSLEKPQGPELTIDEPGGRQLLQQLLSQVPKDAKNVATYPVEVNPFPILGWTNIQATIRYEFFGQTIRRTAMYVHMRPGRLVVFTLSALDADFGKLYKPARAVLASFFEPSRDLPPDLAKKYEDGGGGE